MGKEQKWLLMIAIAACFLIAIQNIVMPLRRNVAMNSFAKLLQERDVHTEQSVTAQIRQLATDSKDPYLYARLSSLLADSHDAQEANVFKAKLIASLNDKYHCGEDVSDFLLTISQSYTLSDHRQASIILRSFEGVGGAVGQVHYLTHPTRQCIQEVDFNFISAPNRYLTLSARLPNLASGHYRLKADIRVDGALSGWFGFRKDWPGTAFPPNNYWTTISAEGTIDTHTSSELVHFLITEGQGKLYISNVSLESIP